VDAMNDLRKSGYYDELFDRYGVLKIDEDKFAIKGPGPA
jgi:polar amino acid transport system substrate-binding protein